MVPLEATIVILVVGELFRFFGAKFLASTIQINNLTSKALGQISGRRPKLRLQIFYSLFETPIMIFQFFDFRPLVLDFPLQILICILEGFGHFRWNMCIDVGHLFGILG